MLYLVLGVPRQRNIVPPLERSKVEAIKKDINRILEGQKSEQRFLLLPPCKFHGANPDFCLGYHTVREYFNHVY